MPLTRREVLRRSLALSAAGSSAFAAATRAVAQEQEPQSTDSEEQPFPFKLPPAGRVQPVPGRKIEGSALSVGFETLDRQHFDPTKTYDQLAGLGAKWARCQTGWCRCEKTKGTYTFDWLDAVVDSLLEIGVRPWFSISYGNQLYTPEADETAVGWAPVFDDEAQQAWVRYTRAIAEHFADRVTHWEIWNEPNIRGFWKPKSPNPADYVDLVKITAPEIRRRVPNAVIIGGAIAGVRMDYIRGCFEHGIGDLIDCLSYHPYRPMPEAGYESDVASMREVIEQHNREIRLWQGENGCPSKGGKGSAGALSNLPWTETRQAKWLLRRILSDLRLGIELTSYFHLVDLVGYRGITNYKGLLRGADYSPKPAFRAYQHLAALFDNQTTRQPDRALELVDEKKVNLQDAAFTRHGKALYTYWYPAKLLDPWTPRDLRIRVASSADARLDKPVLIDPLSGKAYHLRPEAQTANHLTIVVPMLDYPLLVADAGLLSADS